MKTRTAVILVLVLALNGRLPAQVLGEGKMKTSALRPFQGRLLLDWLWNGKPGALWKSESSQPLGRRRAGWEAWARGRGLTFNELKNLPEEAGCLVSALPRGAVGLKAFRLSSLKEEWALYLYARRGRGSGCLCASGAVGEDAGQGSDPLEFPLPPFRSRLASILTRQKGGFSGFYRYQLKWSPGLTGDWLRAQLAGRGFQITRENRDKDGTLQWQITRQGRSFLIQLDDTEMLPGTVMNLFTDFAPTT